MATIFVDNIKSVRIVFFILFFLNFSGFCVVSFFRRCWFCVGFFLCLRVFSICSIFFIFLKQRNALLIINRGVIVYGINVLMISVSGIRIILLISDFFVTFQITGSFRLVRTFEICCVLSDKLFFNISAVFFVVSLFITEISFSSVAILSSNVSKLFSVKSIFFYFYC